MQLLTRVGWPGGAARLQVIAATRQAKRGRRRPRRRGRRASSRPRPRSDQQASQPPQNASPAPIVSTTSTGGAATATSPTRGQRQRAVGAAVSSTTAGPCVEQRPRGLAGRHAGGQPGEVLVGDLDDVGARAARARAARGSAAASAMIAGPAVRVEHHERAPGAPLDQRLERGRPSARARARACRRAGTPRPPGARSSASAAVRPGATRCPRCRSGTRPRRGRRARRARAWSGRRCARAASRRTPSSASSAGQRRAEAVGRDPPEVGDRTLEPAERARGVERPAAGVRRRACRRPPGTRSISASPATTIRSSDARRQRYCSAA